MFLTNNQTLRPVIDSSSKLLLSIGKFQITWYAVIILGGALICSIIAYYRFLKRMGMSLDTLSEGLAFGLLFGILGARLYYVAFSGDHYDSLLEVIDPRSGGLAIHGAIIAVSIYAPIYCKIRHLDLISILEILFPVFMMCQAIGRWGNFVNQEAFGPLIKYPGMTSEWTQLTDANLLAQREFLSKLLIPNFIIDRMYIPYSSASGFTVAGYYHPTFLYESLFNVIGVLLYTNLRKYIKKIYVGDGVSFYLIWYGILRFFIESLRTDALMIGNTGIKVAQLISCLFIVVGIALAVVRRVFKYRLVSCKEALFGDEATVVKKGYVDGNTAKNKVIVFDCDGTLLDTYELIENIVLETFKEINPTYKMTLDEAHTFFGPYINDTFKKYAKDEQELNLYIDTYGKYAELLTAKYIKTYPGIKEALAELKTQGYIICVASNKISKEVNRGLKLCGIDKYIDDVIGAELMTEAKPSPNCINQLKDKYKVKKVLMIGDTETDILTGKNASSFTCGVTWCVSTYEDFKKWGADEIVSDPKELVKLGEKYANRI